ncbi:LamG domain-containing protein [Streptosporangium sp. CA-115845]|uniref:LamG domain-containing protein n=1 Tax=Streptosporangium sp. CA-115845 TaxID=3240071 RepID=UPI003D8DE324
MVASLLVGLSHPAVADPDPGPSPAPVVDEGANALAKARETGQPVEILSQRSEIQQVFAEPDGNQRLVVSARPTRVKKGSTWVDAESELVVRKDGSLGPKAATLDLAFSGGGSGPMVRIVKDGASLSYTWPAPLPTPSIEGNKATYAEVIPGIDLVLSADVEGFSQVLVVKSAQAASRPELAELRVATEVGGGTLNLDKTGNLTLVATDGTVAFHGNAPQMWDSSGSGEESGDRLAGPRTGDAIGEMTARLDGGTLVLTPDQEFLRTPGLTFPLYVDPPMHGASRLAFAYVSKHFSTTKYYGTTDVAKVGYYNDPTVPSGPTVDTYRSFFRMNTAPVNGKHIIKATFRTYETHSWSCTARAVDLWLTGAIGTGTTWSAQPSWTRKISSANVAKGYNSNCAAGGVDFDATSAVVEAASKKWSNLTLGLRAASESDKLGWKKFRNNPTIEITYNTTPNVPDQLSTEVGASSAVSCATGTATPYVTTLTPTLRARVSDADAAKGQTVRAHFEWHVTGGAKIGERYTAYVASGTPVTAPIPSGVFADGANISWRVRAQDGVATSGTSAWSGWCSMIIDRTRPSSAPTVASTDYPETPDGQDPIPSGGVGRMGVFRLTPGPVTDIGGYRYALNNDDPGSATSVTAAADGTATVKVTPPRDLLNVLYVWSRDKAGNIGPYKRYEFSVRAGTSPVGHWKLDETTGTQANDSSSNAYHASVTLGAAWKPGRVSGGVWLNGIAQVTPQKPDAIVRTDANFSVAAWVKLFNKDGGNQTVISQDGVNRSAFLLQYSKGLDRWAMVMTSADTAGAVTYPMATSNASPQIGVWTHLAGSFDAATGGLTLFVDGRQQTATGVQATPWHGAGQFTIGRAMGTSDRFGGGVDDVRVWDRGVYRQEVAGLASHPAAPEGHWRLDETSGTVAADSSGKDRPATASGAYTWSEGWIGGAADFAGTTGQLVTAEPVVRTDRSFTVAAWLKLTDKADYRTAVSQDGVNRSAFYLQYDKAQDRWRFNMPTADTNDTNWTGPFSLNPAQLNTWTHLVGVYDHANNELRLYVDGNRESATTFTTPWNGTGPLAIGRAIKGVNRWAGGIDDVRVYTGVLTDDQIYDLALQ